MWKTQNKVRPGVYVNVYGSRPLAIELGARGTMVLPMDLGFGPTKEFTAIESNADTFSKLGYGISSNEMLLVREALKKASKVLVYRLNDGSKASVSLGTDVNATAIHAGTRGNQLSVIIEANDTKFMIITLLDAIEVDRQKVMTAKEFIPNGFIEITGDGTLSAKSVNLNGGTDTVASKTDYDACFESAKLVDFETIAYTGEDSEVMKSLIEFVKQQRDDEEKKIIGVYASPTNLADYEGIIIVKNGVTLKDGTVLSKDKAVAWVAAASASALVSESNTFAVYEGAEDVDIKMTNAQIENAILAGMFVFTSRKNKVVAEYDLNSLVTYSVEKPRDFRKNKVIRVLDSINNDIVSIFEENFIGKIQNNVEGRNLLKGYLVEYLSKMQEQGAIEDFKSEDVVIGQGTDRDAVLIAVGVKPTDTVDKIYLNVEVK